MQHDAAASDEYLPDAGELGLSRLVHLRRVTSTMDEVHRLAEQGAPAGTCVVADEQSAGRGRSGRSWSSAPRRGLWLTLLERPEDIAAIEVLSLRLGLGIARVLEQLDGSEKFGLKWPNDVYKGTGKIAGVLVEARWREQAIEWVAIGVGVNLRQPVDVDHSAGLTEDVTRFALLQALVPSLRVAASMRGTLRHDELAEWSLRDIARGRRAEQPARGIVQGITASGALRIQDEVGIEREYRSGSLRLADDP